MPGSISSTLPLVTRSAWRPAHGRACSSLLALHYHDAKYDSDKIVHWGAAYLDKEKTIMCRFHYCTEVVVWQGFDACSLCRLLANPVPRPIHVQSGPDKKIPGKRILWATMRIAYVLFSIPSPFSFASKNTAEQEQAQIMMDTTTEIALSIIKVGLVLSEGKHQHSYCLASRSTA